MRIKTNLMAGGCGLNCGCGEEGCCYDGTAIDRFGEHPIGGERSQEVVASIGSRG